MGTNKRPPSSKNGEYTLMNNLAVLPNTKCCPKCKEYKTLEDFHKNRNRAQGRAGVCKSCTSKYGKTHKPKYRKTEQGILTIRLFSIQTKCKERNIPFNLTQEDIAIPKYCPVLGVELNRDFNSPWCATVDRIKPELGYVKGNVIVVSKRANCIKSDATVEEMQRVVDFYRMLDNQRS